MFLNETSSNTGNLLGMFVTDGTVALKLQDTTFSDILLFYKRMCWEQTHLQDDTSMNENKFRTMSLAQLWYVYPNVWSEIDEQG